MFKTSCFVSILLLCACAPAMASLFEYTDDQGVPCVADQLSKVPERYRSKLRVIATKYRPPAETSVPPVKGTPEGVDPAKAESFPEVPRSSVTPIPQPARPPRTPNNVDVYITSWCPACKAMLELLNSQSVSYSAYDIEQDPEAMQRYRAIGGTTIPIVVVGGNQVFRDSNYTYEQLIEAIKR